MSHTLFFARRATAGVALLAAGIAGALAPPTALADSGSAHRQPSTAWSAAAWSEKVAPELLAQMEAAAVSTRSADGPAAQPVRALVNLAAPGVDVAAIEATGAVVTRRYENIPVVAVEVDASAVPAVAALGEVSFVEDVPVATTMDSESFPLTRTDQAHAAGFRGAGTTIAVIDDGIDAAHEAFGAGAPFPNSKVIGGTDVADFDGDPSIDCVDQSHGTATAGVAAANGGGITGTAPDADIVMVKVQSASICGSSSLDGDLVGAIDWVVSNRAALGIDVLSMSLGYGSYSGSCNAAEPAIASAINAATSAGIAVFAASGNSATKSRMSAPACIDNAIAVGAVYDANLGPVRFSICRNRSTRADLVTCYSNSGPSLDLLAPSNNAFTAQAGGGSTSTFGGTSSATPFAAGVAADAIAGGASPSAVRDLLRATGTSVTDPTNGRTTPRVDALAAVNGA